MGSRIRWVLQRKETAMPNSHPALKTVVPNEQPTEDRSVLNRALAQMLKGGVIMDVTTPEQARIAEEAGACAVMALEWKTICALPMI